jgi:hypothetical protein
MCGKNNNSWFSVPSFKSFNLKQGFNSRYEGCCGMQERTIDAKIRKKTKCFTSQNKMQEATKHNVRKHKNPFSDKHFARVNSSSTPNSVPKVLCVVQKNRYMSCGATLPSSQGH